MATITSSIGTTGRTYSTIAAWVASLPANLVTAGNSYVGECYNDSQFTETGVTFSGHTTDSTHTITLTAAAGQSFADNAGKLTNALKYDQTKGVGWTCSNSYGQLLAIADNFVTVSRLQMKETSNNTQFTIFDTGSSFTISQCIVQSVPRNNYNLLYLESGSKAVNCLIIFVGTGSYGAACVRGNNGAFLAECTLVLPTGLGGTIIPINSSYGNNLLVKNTAFFGFGADCLGTYSASSSNNCTDRATAPGSSNQVSKTYANQFQDASNASQDFRLKTGADCINNGVTDTTYNPAAVDIVGTSRPQGAAWDIGAWELVAAAATYRQRVIRWSATR